MPDITSLLQTPPFLPQDAANAYGTGTIINQTQPRPDSAAAAAPDDLQEFVKKNATKSFGDFLNEKMGLDKDSVAKRQAAGQSEAKHKAALFVQTLLGRNFQAEAARDYNTSQESLKNVVPALREQDQAKRYEDLLNTANANRAELARKTDLLNNISQQNVDVKKQRNEDLKDLRNKQLDIQSDLVSGKVTLAQAQAKHQEEVDKFLAKSGGLKGDDAVAFMASQGTPEAQKLLQTFAQMQQAKGLSRAPISLGTKRVSTTAVDGTGNPVNSTVSQRQLVQPGGGILQALGIQGTPANNLGGAVIQGPANAAQAMGLQTPGNTQPAPAPATQSDSPVVNSAYVPGTPPEWLKSAFKGQFSNKENAAMRAETQKLAAGVNGVAEQRANLQDALLTGDAKKYNGLVQGLPTTQKLRALIGTVSPNEALSKPLNYDALFGKLGTSVKGSFRNSEISKAMQSQGVDVDNPWNTLATHSANELMLQAAVADRSKQFANKGVTPEEATKAAREEVARYVDAIGKGATVPGYAKTHPNDMRLKTIQEAIQADRDKGKTQGKKDTSGHAPDKSITDMSDDELLQEYKRLSQNAGAK